MRSTSTAASSGAILGIVFVFLVQQFGLLALTDLATSIVYFAVGAIVGGVIFGLAAWAAGRSRTTPPPA